MQRALVFALAASLATGCSPAARKYLGAGVFFGGGVVAAAGASEIRPCVPVDPTYAEPNHTYTCTTGHTDRVVADPTVGVPLLIGGLLVAGLGVAILVTADHRSESAGSIPQRPSAPFPLDKTTACALTGRYLHQVVSCSGPILLVAGTYAELSDVHLRDDATLDEQRLNVCFEHRAEWVVADATTESCGRAFDQ